MFETEAIFVKMLLYCILTHEWTLHIYLFGTTCSSNHKVGMQSKLMLLHNLKTICNTYIHTFSTFLYVSKCHKSINTYLRTININVDSLLHNEPIG